MNRSAPHPRIAVVLAAMLAIVVVGPLRPAAAQVPTPPDPYEQELPADGPTFIGVATGIPIFVGQAAGTAPSTAGTPVQIASASDFASLVASPGAALAAGVAQFYEQGGGTAYVVPAAGDDAASLTSAIGSVGTGVPSAELVVVPALGALSAPDYLTVAQAMGQLAVTLTGTALLDPPTAMTSAAAQDTAATVTDLIGLATQLRSTVPDPSRVVLYSSGLQVQASGDPVSAAAAMAGLFVASDTANGVWAAPAGLSRPLNGLNPTFAPTNPQIGQLNPDGVNSFRTVPGHGTVAWGARTLATQMPQTYVSAQRTLSYIQKSVTAGLQPYVFAANNVTTWGQVTQDVTGFLAPLWQEGALVGDAASQAYTVEVGVPTSMTSTDVLDGLLIVAIDVALVEPGQMTALSVTQQMGT